MNRQKQRLDKLVQPLFIQWISVKCGIMKGKNLLDSGGFHATFPLE